MNVNTQVLSFSIHLQCLYTQNRSGSSVPIVSLLDNHLSLLRPLLDILHRCIQYHLGQILRQVVWVYLIQKKHLLKIVMFPSNTVSKTCHELSFHMVLCFLQRHCQSIVSYYLLLNLLILYKSIIYNEFNPSSSITYLVLSQNEFLRSIQQCIWHIRTPSSS